jgi:hypothetical protein
MGVKAGVGDGVVDPPEPGQRRRDGCSHRRLVGGISGKDQKAIARRRLVGERRRLGALSRVRSLRLRHGLDGDG